MNEVKTKRIKRVFSNPSDVLHLWANQSQTDARSKTAYFNGVSCYSYGSHYELGRLVQYKGQTVALVNARGYSHTTSKHISFAWGAVSHMLRIKHDGTAWDVRAALVQTQGKLVDELMGLFSQRSFWSLYNPFEENDYGMEGSIREFNKLCLQLGHAELTLDTTNEFKALVKAHISKCVARQAELKNIKASPEYHAKMQAKALAKNAADIQRWRLGGIATNGVRSIRPMLLRIQGDNVNTSSGATVPLSEALRLLRTVESGIAKDGDSVGSYTFNRSNSDGTVTIGCHTIAIDEAKAVLGQVKTLKLVG
jgi:hypothetical protein